MGWACSRSLHTTTGGPPMFVHALQQVALVLVAQVVHGGPVNVGAIRVHDRCGIAKQNHVPMAFKGDHGKPSMWLAMCLQNRHPRRSDLPRWPHEIKGGWAGRPLPSGYSAKAAQRPCAPRSGRKAARPARVMSRWAKLYMSAVLMERGPDQRETTTVRVTCCGGRRRQLQTWLRSIGPEKQDFTASINSANRLPCSTAFLARASRAASACRHGRRARPQDHRFGLAFSWVARMTSPGTRVGEPSLDREGVHAR